MNDGRIKRSARIGRALLLVVLPLAGPPACVGPAREAGRSCPCGAGWTCCEQSDLCQPAGESCRAADSGALPMTEPGDDAAPTRVADASTDAAPDATMARKTLTFDCAGRPALLWYDGNVEQDQSLTPRPVSGCIPGTELPTKPLVYTEDEDATESPQRILELDADGPCLAQLHTLVGPLDDKGKTAGTADLGDLFGVDVWGEVSSSVLNGLALGVSILPGEYGVLYRQTHELKRVAHIAYDDGSHEPTERIGRLVLTDWAWSVQLGKALSCPPLPAPSMDLTDAI